MPTFRHLLVAVTCTWFVTAHAQQIQRLDGSRLEAAQAQALADAELQRDHVMGAQLAILNHGRVVWTHAYGLRAAEPVSLTQSTGDRVGVVDGERQLPMTTDTNTWAASITKSVFATWVMRQVELGRFSLDEPLVKILPKPLTEYEEYRESAADVVRDPRWATVTPRMLLSHTSGLANFAQFEPDRKMHLHFTPGERYAYSGEGINLVQLCVEARTGEGLSAAIDRDVFVPLAMKQTGMQWHDSFAANTAYRYNAQRKPLGMTRRLRARAAGNMSASVNDLGRFTGALLAGKLMKDTTRAQMWTPQIAIRSATQFPTLSTATSDEGPRVGLSYGLGWGLLTKTKFGPAFFKEGHGDGAETYLICFAGKRRRWQDASCMILLTNDDNGELAFRPLLEQLLGDTVTPWAWEGYRREDVLANEEHKAK